MAEDKKKYWIKLEKNFLNSSQIKVIKHMQNGKDYIIFYLALMLESTNTEGHLRFSELVPYNEEMLASVTDTNVDIVRSAIKVFQSLGMLQILENGTIFLPDVPKRVGKESESAERVRVYREKQGLLQCNDDVTNCNDNKEKDKDKEKDKERREEESVRGEEVASAPQKQNSISRFKKPTVEEVAAYCKERGNSINPSVFVNFYESKGWKVGNSPMKDWKAAVRTWEQKEKQQTPQTNAIQNKSKREEENSKHLIDYDKL